MMNSQLPQSRFQAVLTVLVMFLLSACASHPEVVPGVEVLVRDHTAQLRGLKVGIVTNPTGVNRELKSTIDVVRAIDGVTVVRLFSPEHGIRGQHFAGDHIDETHDPVSGLPVMSLYGQTRKPSAEMLEGLDVVLYDIQDVGHRTYTYVSTLTLLMEACEEANVAVWVLDRPDPMGGTVTGGPMVDADLRSFIGIHNVPQVYGMTPGEWAQMIKSERTLGIDLKVIAMDGWRRGMNYGDLGWIWIPPSQHIPTWESAYFYAMTGTIGALRKVNEGVGTPTPFQLIGAPWLDTRSLTLNLTSSELDGVIFRPTVYKPRYGTHSDTLVNGVQIHISDYDQVDPPAVSMALLRALREQSMGNDSLLSGWLKPDGSPSGFLKALGDRKLAELLVAGQALDTWQAQHAERIEDFRQRRQQYLIYP